MSKSIYSLGRGIVFASYGQAQGVASPCVTLFARLLLLLLLVSLTSLCSAASPSCQDEFIVDGESRDRVLHVRAAHEVYLLNSNFFEEVLIDSWCKIRKVVVRNCTFVAFAWLTLEAHEYAENVELVIEDSVFNTSMFGTMIDVSGSIPSGLSFVVRNNLLTSVWQNASETDSRGNGLSALSYSMEVEEGEAHVLFENNTVVLAQHSDGLTFGLGFIEAGSNDGANITLVGNRINITTLTNAQHAGGLVFDPLSWFMGRNSEITIRSNDVHLQSLSSETNQGQFVVAVYIGMFIENGLVQIDENEIITMCEASSCVGVGKFAIPVCGVKTKGHFTLSIAEPNEVRYEMERNTIISAGADGGAMGALFIDVFQSVIEFTNNTVVTDALHVSYGFLAQKSHNSVFTVSDNMIDVNGGAREHIGVGVQATDLIVTQCALSTFGPTEPDNLTVVVKSNLIRAAMTRDAGGGVRIGDPTASVTAPLSNLTAAIEHNFIFVGLSVVLVVQEMKAVEKKAALTSSDAEMLGGGTTTMQMQRGQLQTYSLGIAAEGDGSKQVSSRSFKTAAAAVPPWISMSPSGVAVYSISFSDIRIMHNLIEIDSTATGVTGVLVSGSIVNTSLLVNSSRIIIDCSTRRAADIAAVGIVGSVTNVAVVVTLIDANLTLQSQQIGEGEGSFMLTRAWLSHVSISLEANTVDVVGNDCRSVVGLLRSQAVPVEGSSRHTFFRSTVTLSGNVVRGFFTISDHISPETYVAALMLDGKASIDSESAITLEHEDYSVTTRTGLAAAVMIALSVDAETAPTMRIHNASFRASSDTWSIAMASMTHSMGLAVAAVSTSFIANGTKGSRKSIVVGALFHTTNITARFTDCEFSTLSGASELASGVFLLPFSNRTGFASDITINSSRFAMFHSSADDLPAGEYDRLARTNGAIRISQEESTPRAMFELRLEVHRSHFNLSVPLLAVNTISFNDDDDDDGMPPTPPPSFTGDDAPLHFSALDINGNSGFTTAPAMLSFDVPIVETQFAMTHNRFFTSGTLRDLIDLKPPREPKDFMKEYDGSNRDASGSQMRISCNILNGDRFLSIDAWKDVSNVSFTDAGCTATRSVTASRRTHSQSRSASHMKSTSGSLLVTLSWSTTRETPTISRSHSRTSSRRSRTRSPSQWTATLSVSRTQPTLSLSRSDTGHTKSPTVAMTISMLRTVTVSSIDSATRSLSSSASVTLRLLPLCPQTEFASYPTTFRDVDFRSMDNMSARLTFLDAGFQWSDMVRRGAVRITAAPVASLPDARGFDATVGSSISLLDVKIEGQTLVIPLPRTPNYEIAVDERLQVRFWPEAVIPRCRPRAGGPDAAVVAASPVVTAAPRAETQATIILATTATATATAVSLAGGGAAALDAQTMAIMGQMSCARPADRKSTESMMLFLSPFARVSDAAVALGNLGIIILFGGLQWCGVVVFKRRNGVGDITAMAAFRFPGMTFSIACLLHQGISFASFQLLFSGSSAALDVIATIVGSIYVLALPIAVHYGVKRFVRVGFTEYGPFRSKPRWLKWMLPKGFWTPDEQRKSFGKAFTSMDSSHIYWGIYPVVLVGVINFVASIRPPASYCFLQFLLIGILFFLAAAIIAKLRPHRSHFLNIAACTSLVSLCFVSISKAVQARYHSPMAVRVQTGAIWTQMAIVLVRMVYDFVILFMEMRYWHAMMRPRARIFEDDFLEMDLLGTADAKKGDGDPLLVTKELQWSDSTDSQHDSSSGKAESVTHCSIAQPRAGHDAAHTPLHSTASPRERVPGRFVRGGAADLSPFDDDDYNGEDVFGFHLSNPEPSSPRPSPSQPLRNPFVTHQPDSWRLAHAEDDDFL